MQGIEVLGLAQFASPPVAPEFWPGALPLPASETIQFYFPYFIEHFYQNDTFRVWFSSGRVCPT